ncbi:MAG TPA: glycerol-3-phosphate acyltransferase, partial [Candidatus Baltobacteraceae bacterium]|nr:glycerol-3-phosphate acyltransferase [Candidatus Baltobacteraceae bacterium]
MDVGLPEATARAIMVEFGLVCAGTFLAGFLIGSIPFGYIIGRWFYRTDIRKEGSGNIGAMNALRTLGKTGAVAVLLLDAVKGFAPVFAFTLYASWMDAG